MKKSTKIILIIPILLVVIWFAPVIPKKEVVCIPFIGDEAGWNSCTTVKYISLKEVIFSYAQS
jgi:hypothetical protein